MKVNIDPYAGFCFGVKKTIEIAEKELQEQDKLYCIGDIVHNQEEINRLEKSGLIITNFDLLQEENKSSVIFRAHGEPPSSYKKANKNGFTVIDGTCPIVLKLQQKIKGAYTEMKKVDGQVVIYGSKKHPEVVGLAGYTNDEAIILESIDDIDQIDFNKPIRMFAQTTKDKKKYKLIQEAVNNKSIIKGSIPDFKFFNSICGQVSNRVPKLKEFCKENETIVFVSGKKSSNGNFLFNICKSTNINSYFVSSVEELNNNWFKQINTVGISGATSTPTWLMKQIAEKIISF